MIRFLLHPREEVRLKEYLLEHLSSGKEFNAGLGSIVGSWSGRMSLLLPDDAIYVPRATNLEWALPVRVQHSDAEASGIDAEDALGAIAKLAERELLDGRAGLLIVEDAVGAYSDLSERDISHRRIIVGETIYRVGAVDETTRATDCLDVCRSSENAWSWTGACVSGRWPFGRERVASVDSSTVQILASEARMVFALAFDGDGAVVWQRS